MKKVNELSLFALTWRAEDARLLACNYYVTISACISVLVVSGICAGNSTAGLLLTDVPRVCSDLSVVLNNFSAYPRYNYFPCTFLVTSDHVGSNSCNNTLIIHNNIITQK